MIRALWLLVKIGFVIGLILWIVERPGVVTIEWLDYQMRVQVGFFLLVMLGLVVLGIVIFSLIKGVLDFPQIWARYVRYRNRVRGMRALTTGLSAVAAGDARGAMAQAAKARSLLTEEEPLSILLTAQAARLGGDHAGAVEAFGLLAQRKDGAFLGLRGLLQAALDSGDDRQALEIGRRALQMHAKQGWLIKIVYDLEIRLRNWDTALLTLLRAERVGVFTREKAQSDRLALYMAQAQDAGEQNNSKLYFKLLSKAQRIDKNFVPVVLALGRYYLERQHYRAAIALIEKTWRTQPHPDLVQLWTQARQAQRGEDMTAAIHWQERLVALNPQSVEGIMALARVLMREGLWGEARKNLEKAELLSPSGGLYKLWAELEERATRDEIAARHWLDRAGSAPMDKAWICKETGRVYAAWSPISDQGLFNTIIWDYPQGRAEVFRIAPPQW